MQMTTIELARVVERHDQWIKGHAGGRRADLRDADLSGVDLRGADLRGANLRGANLRGANLMGEIIQKNPLQLSGLRWPVAITEKFMVIGCQRHSHDRWSQMTDEEISQLHPDAPAFWAKHKTALMAICNLHAISDDCG